jgi:hypothetical protein
MRSYGKRPSLGDKVTDVVAFVRAHRHLSRSWLLGIGGDPPRRFVTSVLPGLRAHRYVTRGKRGRQAAGGLDGADRVGALWVGPVRYHEAR